MGKILVFQVGGSFLGLVRCWVNPSKQRLPKKRKVPIFDLRNKIGVVSLIRKLLLLILVKSFRRLGENTYSQYEQADKAIPFARKGVGKISDGTVHATEPQVAPKASV